MQIEENPYRGIIFFPAAVTNQFAATLGHGSRARIVGYFPTLQEAIDARADYIETLRQHDRLETRPRFA